MLLFSKTVFYPLSFFLFFCFLCYIKITLGIEYNDADNVYVLEQKVNTEQIKQLKYNAANNFKTNDIQELSSQNNFQEQKLNTQYYFLMYSFFIIVQMVLSAIFYLRFYKNRKRVNISHKAPNESPKDLVIEVAPTIYYSSSKTTSDIKHQNILKSRNLTKSVTSCSNRKDLKFKLLIVEDNIDFCKYLEAILADEYKLVFVHNGIQAMNYLRTNLVDLVITDCIMPQMGGFELSDKLKASENLANLPILMLTAKSLIIDEIKASKIGIDDYLTKPIRKELLKKRVAKLLLTKRENRESTTTILSSSSSLQLSPTEQNWLIKTEEIINAILSDPQLNVGQVANLCNISERHLNRKIKDITGFTAKKYIQEMRFWEARKMLETGTHNSVKAVAFSVGFKNPKVFSKKFKERFDKTPSKYLYAYQKNKYFSHENKLLD